MRMGSGREANEYNLRKLDAPTAGSAQHTCGHEDGGALMGYVALHRSSHTSLATDQVYLSAEELSSCESARALLHKLEQQLASRQSQVDLAFKAACAEGYAAGRSAALEQVAPAFVSACERASVASAAEVDGMRSAIIELSVQVVQRVAKDLAEPDVLVALARRAVETLVPDQAVVLRVHPDLIEAVRAGMACADSTAVRLEVRGDSSLGELDCVLDTPAGELLAGLATQLARISASLHATQARALVAGH